MRASQATITVIDFETTGSVKGWPSEPWQVGMVRIVGGQMDEAATFDRLLRIGDRPFNRYAPGRHSELREELASAPTLQELWPELKDWWLHTPLAAHNISTEKTVMRKAAPLHRFGPWIDTLKLARIAWPGAASYALEDLVPALDLTEQVTALCPGRAPHDALYDAVACAVLLCRLLKDPAWQELPLDRLVHSRIRSSASG